MPSVIQMKFRHHKPAPHDYGVEGTRFAHNHPVLTTSRWSDERGGQDWLPSFERHPHLIDYERSWCAE